MAEIIHSKYGYDQSEMYMMVVTTALTNLAVIPTICMFYQQKKMLQVFGALLATVPSFMYHLLESLDIKEIFLGEGQWHRLDNVGSICCFSCLFVYLMDNQDDFKDAKFNYSYFGISILAQEAHPWNIYYTVVPILIAIVLYIIVRFSNKNRRSYNYRMLIRGLFIYSLAIPCFYFALDEYSDYLRISHGLWHVFIGFGSFFFWQATARENEVVTMKEVLFPQPYTRILPARNSKTSFE